MGGAPSSSLVVSPSPVDSVLDDTETGWLCIFTPQHFIDFLQQTGQGRGGATAPGNGEVSVL